MKLKAVIDSLDDVEEAMRQLYEESTIKVDGKDKTVFVLGIENVDAHPQVFALRDSRRKDRQTIADLTKERDELKLKVADLPDDFDIDAYDTMKAELEQYKKNPGASEKEIEERVKASYEAKAAQDKAKTERERKKDQEALAAANERADRAEGRLKSQLIDAELTKALDEAGVTKPAFRKAAKAMLIKDALVEEEDGELKVRMKPELGGDDLAKYVTGVWAQSDEGKVFVEPAKGSDAPGSGKPNGGGSGRNPWSKEDWNIGEQTKIYRQDPAKAKRLAAEHGHKIGF